MKHFVLALDQGTTSSRAILFDHEGVVHSSASQEFNQYYPQPGWVEHDPEEIWRSQMAAAEEAMAHGPGGRVDSDQIAAIGIANQRETVLLWDRATSTPIHPAIVWQCRRTASRCDQIRTDGFEPVLRD